MNTRKLSRMAMVAAMTAVLSLGGGLSFAADGDKAKPEKSGQKEQGAGNAGSKASHAKGPSPHLAAKREMVRNQQQQRVTNEQRKTAAENLKAERLKVYNAKQAVKKSKPQTIENK